MNKLLEYPFDSQLLMKKKKSIKRELLSYDTYIEKRIAVLGGSTTSEIKDMLELFLLNYGIKPTFYESEYGRYWQEAVFFNEALEKFAPEVVFIHTTNRNIDQFPSVRDSQEEIDELIQKQYRQFAVMWDKLREKYGCPIIQNNFEPPLFRLLGNKEVSDIHGRINFINRINDLMYTYARTHTDFYVNDINYLSAVYGLDQWADPFYWYMYKYALSLPAVPHLAFNVSKIIKSIFGKNKKAMVVDLDNTLWKGVMDIDRCGFFEVTSFSDDDTRRNDMYMANAIRAKAEDAFADYEEYLCSLEMSAEIKNFDEIYMQRISQLTNKTNQFNLTTRRLSYAEICTIAADDNYISLYGKLTDKYGDNGVVTVVIGKKNILSKTLDIDVWLMSCRVLKRKMEYAMLDAVVERAKASGLQKIRGYYFKTKKNELVADFYEEMGFSNIQRTEDESIWELEVADYIPQNHIITVLEGN